MVKGPWNEETGSCPCRCWNRFQHEWFAFIERVGGEAAAKKELVARLRDVADHIERGPAYPDVFGCLLPQKPLGKELIQTFSVTLSMPWPG